MQTLSSFPFWSGTLPEAVSKIESVLSASTSSAPFVVFTPNPEQLMYANAHTDFAALLHQRASLLLPDGSGLVWAWKYLGLGSLQRVSGIDVVASLLGLEARQTQRMLIIGGRDYAGATICGFPVRECPSRCMSSPTPGLYWTPGFGHVAEPTGEERERLRECLCSLQPELVFVAFGAPAQERFIAEYYDLFCQTKTRVVMAVGGSFDVLSGKLRRAPFWMQRVGLEWLFRLVQQPWRLSRQLHLIHFVWEVLTTPRPHH